MFARLTIIAFLILVVLPAQTSGLFGGIQGSLFDQLNFAAKQWESKKSTKDHGRPQDVAQQKTEISSDTRTQEPSTDLGDLSDVGQYVRATLSHPVFDRDEGMPSTRSLDLLKIPISDETCLFVVYNFYLFCF
jgi:hypothetical protein